MGWEWPQEHVDFMLKKNKEGCSNTEAAKRLNKRFGTKHTRDSVAKKRYRLKKSGIEIPRTRPERQWPKRHEERLSQLCNQGVGPRKASKILSEQFNRKYSVHAVSQKMQRMLLSSSPHGDYFSVSDAARVFRVKQERIYRLIDKGVCNPERKGKYFWLSYEDMDKLEQYLAYQELPEPCYSKKEVAKLLDYNKPDSIHDILRRYPHIRSYAVRRPQYMPNRKVWIESLYTFISKLQIDFLLRKQKQSGVSRILWSKWIPELIEYESRKS